MMKGWPNTAASLSATSRAAVSLGPAGGNGAMTCTGLLGQVSA